MKDRALLFFVVIFCFLSCDNQDEPIRIKTQEVLIPINISIDKELDLSERALPREINTMISTTKDAHKDLYAIQVYDEDNFPYAYVVGDDIEKVILELSSGKEYDIQVTYIENGKDIIKREPNSEAAFGMPFSTYNPGEADLNKVYYDNGNHLAYLGWHKITTEGPIFHQRHTAANRYYNFLKFEPDPENLEMKINLKRVSIGINLEIDLGQETDLEYILFTPEGSNSYTVHLKKGKGSLHIPYLTLPGNEGLRALDEIVKTDHTEDFKFTIGTDESLHHFYAGQIAVKRNTIYNLTATYQNSENKRKSIDQEDRKKIKVQVREPKL